MAKEDVSRPSSPLHVQREQSKEAAVDLFSSNSPLTIISSASSGEDTLNQTGEKSPRELHQEANESSSSVTDEPATPSNAAGSPESDIAYTPSAHKATNISGTPHRKTWRIVTGYPRNKMNQEAMDRVDIAATGAGTFRRCVITREIEECSQYCHLLPRATEEGLVSSQL